jgi:CRP/FNR family transcriptional regulator, cyclic AMP receptor protein
MRLRKDAKAELIRHVPLFSRCSSKELAEVASIADEIDLPEGRELTTEGERGREFLVLVEGTAEVTRDGRPINDLSSGDFLGEIAILSDLPRTATVTTTSPVRALVIRDVEFKTLIRHQPGVAASVLEALADRLARDSL